jgi:serine/threonine protein kinase
MIGGAIVGQGTYGCAVNPPFLCKGQFRTGRKEKQPTDKVGKITLNSDAAIEVYISKQVRKIPNWEHYFVLVEPDACKPSFIGRADNWKGCTITETYEPKNLSQVISRFGGTSFSSLGRMNYRQNLQFYYGFFRKLLEACALLTLNGIVHFDLHRSNVLIDKAGQARIFDFGMAFQELDINDDIISERWKLYDPSFDSETPEITVITGIRKGMALETAVLDVVSRKPVLKEYEAIYGVSRNQMSQRLYNFFLKSRSFQEKNWVAFFKTYWPVFDSFSIGAILLNVLKILLTIPEFVESSRWKEEGAKILAILKEMIRVDPSERYDCVEALYAYDPKNDALKGSEAWISARKQQRMDLTETHQ